MLESFKKYGLLKVYIKHFTPEPIFQLRKRQQGKIAQIAKRTAFDLHLILANKISQKTLSHAIKFAVEATIEIAVFSL